MFRRRLTEEFLDLMLELGRGRLVQSLAYGWQSNHASHRAFNNAIHRLEKKGLIVSSSKRGGAPDLELTERGLAQRPDVLRPSIFWNRPWNGIWYVLVYDVPESNRTYRGKLRGFLRKMRMGRLQDSVWVTPCDIRPEYADLVQAAELSQFSYLLEARTVLGQAAAEIVLGAWDFDRIGQAHSRYREVFEQNLVRVNGGGASTDELLELARFEVAAYMSVMKIDPLLPRKLWPPDYRGDETFRLHRELSTAIRRRI